MIRPLLSAAEATQFDDIIRIRIHIEDALGGSIPSPEPADAIGVEEPLDGDQHQIVQDRLGDQHAVKRVAARSGQGPG